MKIPYMKQIKENISNMNDIDLLHSKIEIAEKIQHGWIESVGLKKSGFCTIFGLIGLISFFGFFIAMGLSVSGKNYGLETILFFIVFLVFFIVTKYYEIKSISLLKTKLKKLIVLDEEMNRKKSACNLYVKSSNS